LLSASKSLVWFTVSNALRVSREAAYTVLPLLGKISTVVRNAKIAFGQPVFTLKPTTDHHTQTVAVLGFTFGGSRVVIIAAGGTDLYCHSEPPLTSGKLCFIINFIGGPHREAEFLLGAASLASPLNRPALKAFVADVQNNKFKQFGDYWS